MIIDTHAHYDDEQFDTDREELLDSMEAGGIGLIVNAGSTVESWDKIVRLTERYPFLYGAIGVHPDEAGSLDEEKFSRMSDLLDLDKIVAVGEIGLDYYYDFHPRELQRFWFRQQLRLAESVHKPIIIHSRDAAQETFDIIQSSAVRQGVIHCYSGAWQMAEDYVKMGFLIGIGGVITFSNAKKLTEVVERIPLKHILIETDSPYLAPNPNRGKRNDSRNLQFIVKKIAEIKNISPEDVAKVTFDNAKSLFF